MCCQLEPTQKQKERHPVYCSVSAFIRTCHRFLYDIQRVVDLLIIKFVCLSFLGSRAGYFKRLPTDSLVSCLGSVCGVCKRVRVYTCVHIYSACVLYVQFKALLGYSCFYLWTRGDTIPGSLCVCTTYVLLSVKTCHFSFTWVSYK